MLEKNPWKCYVLYKRNFIIHFHTERAKTFSYVMSEDGCASVEEAEASPVCSLELVQQQGSRCIQIVALDCIPFLPILISVAFHMYLTPPGVSDILKPKISGF